MQICWRWFGIILEQYSGCNITEVARCRSSYNRKNINTHFRRLISCLLYIVYCNCSISNTLFSMSAYIIKSEWYSNSCIVHAYDLNDLWAWIFSTDFAMTSIRYSSKHFALNIAATSYAERGATSSSYNTNRKWGRWKNKWIIKACCKINSRFSNNNNNVMNYFIRCDYIKRAVMLYKITSDRRELN